MKQEERMRQAEIKGLKKGRKELCDEFEKWGTISNIGFSKKEFLQRMHDIDKRLYELGEPPTLNYQP